MSMSRTIAHGKNDKRTIEQKQESFIEAFCALANVTKAAAKARVGRRTVYDWLANDPEFKKAYTAAEPVALGVLEDEATRRAVEGVNKPIYYKGDQVGTMKEYSDTLMIVLLKARAPEKYKERTQIDAKNTNVNYNADLTPEEVKKIAKDLEGEY